MCLGIGLLLLTLGYLADTNFLQKNLSAVKEQKLKTSHLLRNKKQEAQKAESKPQEIKTRQRQYEEKLKHFASNFDLADILNSLEKAATDSQIVLQLLEPQTIKEDETFVVYPIKIEINGQYQNLLKFINNIFKQRYFIALDDLILQKNMIDERSDELNMRSLLMVYKNKIIANTPSNNPPPTYNIAISLPKHNIFTKTTKDSGKINLFLWAVKELRFLGVIKQKQTIYGIVSDPAGIVHRVAIGDKIGLKQSKIMVINERGVSTIDETGNIYWIGAKK